MRLQTLQRNFVFPPTARAALIATPTLLRPGCGVVVAGRLGRAASREDS